MRTGNLPFNVLALMLCTGFLCVALLSGVFVPSVAVDTAWVSQLAYSGTVIRLMVGPLMLMVRQYWTCWLSCMLIPDVAQDLNYAQCPGIICKPRRHFCKKVYILGGRGPTTSWKKFTFWIIISLAPFPNGSLRAFFSCPTAHAIVASVKAVERHGLVLVNTMLGDDSRGEVWILGIVVLYGILDTQHTRVIKIWYSHQRKAQYCLEGMVFQLTVANCCDADAACRAVMSPRESTTYYNPDVTWLPSMVSTLCNAGDDWCHETNLWQSETACEVVTNRSVVKLFKCSIPILNTSLLWKTYQ